MSYALTSSRPPMNDHPGCFNVLATTTRSSKRRHLWQAELTFIHNCWYPQFELSISTIPVIHRYKMLLIFLPGCGAKTQQFELWISVIWIADIDNCTELSISTIQITDIRNSNYWYPQFQLLISTIWIVDINNNCRYQQLNVDINNLNYGYPQFELWISAIVNKC